MPPRIEHIFHNGVEGKDCSRCGEWTPLSGFYKQRANSDGLKGQCKKCCRAYDKQWELDNLEQRREDGRQWYWNNLERSKENSKQFHLDNPEYRKQYRLSHLEALAQYQNKRDAIKRGCKRHHIEKEWRILCEIYGHRCLCCGKREPFEQYCTVLTRDHVIPPIFGGEDDIENIQPLCGECNSAKGQQTWDFR